MNNCIQKLLLIFISLIILTSIALIYQHKSIPYMLLLNKDNRTLTETLVYDDIDQFLYVYEESTPTPLSEIEKYIKTHDFYDTYKDSETDSTNYNIKQNILNDNNKQNN